MQENEVSVPAGFFSSGTNGAAVADDTNRLISGGGTGGQLPPEGGDVSAPDTESFCVGGI